MPAPLLRRPVPAPLALALAALLPTCALASAPAAPPDAPAVDADAGAGATASNGAPDPAQAADRHARDLDAVVVTASPLPDTADNLLHPVEVLAGQRLDEAKSNSLGGTVDKLPGVQSSYFGPGVGRPIIRGFDGARVQVLSDGLGSGDVSTVSVDHAVSVEPFLAEQVEVLKGPSTLLYGSGAIGGAVNVVDGRVPQAATDEPLEGRAELRADSVNDGTTGMARLDGTSADGHLVFHFDALHRETGDYEIPGYAESAAHLAEEGETPDPATRGILPNSAVRTDSGALGVSWVGERGFIGAAYSLFNSRYGVPGHEHGHGADDEHEHGHEAEDGDHAEGGVQIVMDQRRGELRGGLDDVGPFATLRVKLARTEYTHTEYEGDEVGTVFDNDATEGRLELVHRTWAGWDGAFGLQWGQRDFAAVGDEAFVPASASRDAGVFWIGRRQFDALRLELGARHDRNRVDVDEARAIGGDRGFDTNSVSAALQWTLGDALHLSFGLDRAQRAPTAEELYSSGLHVATASVELGDPRLDAETANRAELGLHWHGGPLSLAASLYHVRYADFIYLAETGVEEHDGPVRLWMQDDARFTGAEASADWRFADNASGAWNLRAFGDVVRGELSGSGTRQVGFAVPHGDHSHDYSVAMARGGNLPRIAPWRAGGELRWESGPWRAAVDAVRYAKQDRVAELETPTPGYTLVGAHLAWHADTAAGNAWELFVDGSNLLDEEARSHTSFLKDLAPLPGRGFAFGVRAYF